ncbi:hypothetical protein N665_1129s0005 [Sinapis alba]|nr:hypothetical protein N665_1129s0005 [Sinapis alba]
MGASSSTDSKESSEKREIESLAASTGALPLLQQSFSKLADSQTNTLSFQSFKQSFTLSYNTTTCEGEQPVPDSFPRLMEHLGPSLVDLFFVSEKEGGLSWFEFAQESLEDFWFDELHDECGPSRSIGEDDGSASKTCQNTLLTCGRAWSISLACKNTISEEILSSCFPCTSDETNENLLYRSYHHGKCMNRMWDNVQGYHAPILILVSASCGDDHEGTSRERKWVIGAILQQGFKNRDTFYENSGNLFSIIPVFHAFSSSDYDATPKPVGFRFGGTQGNERVFIDEDFAKVTIRHHAVDKTYEPGSLFPNQALGGKAAKEVQEAYKKREDLFTDQRRKIDLKTFTNWEDSPEKMMMNIMGNPNAPRKEER